MRGGCSCAGPYGHALLNIDEERSRAIATQIAEGRTVLRPGWVRLNFNYFLSEEEFEYLLSAIELVAEHGWRLLSHYALEERTGLWRHRDAATAERSSLLDEAVFENTGPVSRHAPVPLAPLTTVAKSVLLGAYVGERMALEDDLAIEDPLRWFALASDGASEAAQNSNEIVF